MPAWSDMTARRDARERMDEPDCPTERLLRTVEHFALLNRLVARYRTLEAALATPWTVNGMADIDPGFDYRLNVRGDYDQLGEPVPRGYLRVLDRDAERRRDVPNTTGPRGSGRRELARQVASPQNPLTARVFVNRVWHWLFGAGLVPTPDNFGSAGQRPSHPELLDYLASRFVRDGWSVKTLVRELVLSETWCQSQQADPTALTLDPANRLWHHYPLRRLDAEAIRDAMLYGSGRLDNRRFGPPLDPHRPQEDPQKRLFSGPLDGAGRRSIYTRITIMEPPRMLATLNQPKPKIPTGKRDMTATPAQSLTLLNDPFVVQQAQAWAQRLVGRPPEPVAERIGHVFRRAFGRPPGPAETERWTAAVEDFSVARGVDQDDLMKHVAVWTDVVHAVFNTQEFIYLR